MRLSQMIEREKADRGTAKRPHRKGLMGVARHRAFVPMLSVWGAALFGLCVLAMPASAVTNLGRNTGLDALGPVLLYGLAGLAALIGAIVCFVIAKAIRSRAMSGHGENSIVVSASDRRIRPIDPVRELGSASLDAPLEDEPAAPRVDRSDNAPEDDALELQVEWQAELAADSDKSEPTLGELSERGYAAKTPEDSNDDSGYQPAFTHRHFRRALIESCEGASCEASPADLEETEAEEQHEAPQDSPRALDLAEFAQLPGRNAVWVEDATQEEVAAEVAPSEASPPPEPKPAPVPATALEKLRQRPADELSLVEMVERFAAALHEHQQNERILTQSAQQSRDAALAEALKALTLFTDNGFDRPAPASAQDNQLSQTESDLREALAKLQTLRGAA